MADLTDEELDRARAEEAMRIWDSENGNHSLGCVAEHAARLAREGWTPPKPVDPDLIEAREIAATANDQQDFRHTASAYRGGTWDSSIEVQATLTAIKQTKAKFAAVLDWTPGDVAVFARDVLSKSEDGVPGWVIAEEVVGATIARIREKAGL